MIVVVVVLLASALPDPRDTPFVDVTTAGQLLHIGRSKAYELCRRFLNTAGADGIPAVSFGRSIRVPVAALWRLAGLEPPGQPDTRPAPEDENPGGEVLSLPVTATAKGARHESSA